MSDGIWKTGEDGPRSWRRSVYVYRKRGLPFPMFEVFDLPDQNISCGRRNVSTVPTQALTLLNDDFVLRQSKLFADRVRGSGAGRCRRSRWIWRTGSRCRGRRREAKRSWRRISCGSESLADFTHVLLNLNEFLYVR